MPGYRTAVAKEATAPRLAPMRHRPSGRARQGELTLQLGHQLLGEIAPRGPPRRGTARSRSGGCMSTAINSGISRRWMRLSRTTCSAA